MRPDREDIRKGLIEFGLTTVLMFGVVTLVRWGIGPMAADATATEVRIRIAIAGLLSGALIAGLILSRPGRVSGAHVNPAITVSLFAFGALPRRRVLPYLAAQSAGSIAGTALGRGAWGTAVSAQPVNWAVIQPGTGWGCGAVLVAETTVMGLIVGVMCWVMARRPAWPLPWIVGAMIGTQAAVLGTLTGGCVNPIRQLGPAVLSGQTHLLGVYLIAPIVGGALAGWAVRPAVTTE